ncbi:MAG: MlaD family protein [Ignavibacteria bacterium]|nr:MlaD family protein [Ignavibacteria bacterium]
MDVGLRKKVITGVFIVTGITLFIIASFIIGSKTNMFRSTFELGTVFENVGGIKEGNTVTYAGINVGTVDKVKIESPVKVLVTMTIDSKVQQFIKKDSKVSITSEGLVGNKVVSISSGNTNTPSVQSGDVLESVKPVGVEDIIKELKSTGENVNKLTKDLSNIVDSISHGKGTIGQLVNNESLFRSVDSTFRGFASSTQKVDIILAQVSGAVDKFSRNFDGLSNGVSAITQNIGEISAKINSSQSLVGTLLTDTVFANNLKQIVKNTNETTAKLEDGAFSFAQNMEALKHNFLFKGYFEDIGYWEKSDVDKKINAIEEQIRNRIKELNEKKLQLKQIQNQLDSLGRQQKK